MGTTAGIFLASILLKEMRYLVYIRYLWSGVKSVLLFVNADPNPYPDQDKTARHESKSRLRLLPSFTTNILDKFVVIFVPNEGRRTKTGYSFMSRSFFWVRARIRVSIHKQQHRRRGAEQPPVTSSSICAR